MDDNLEWFAQFRRFAWWHTVMTAPDQLRQRVAFSLSEIMVASDNVDILLVYPYSLSGFTTSDFGRTFTSNGKGSDHGWGGHHMVMGGNVSGATLYGDYPILSWQVSCRDGSSDTERASLAPCSGSPYAILRTGAQP